MFLTFPVVLRHAATGACLLRTTATLRFIPNEDLFRSNNLRIGAAGPAKDPATDPAFAPRYFAF